MKQRQTNSTERFTFSECVCASENVWECQCVIMKITKGAVRYCSPSCRNRWECAELSGRLCRLGACPQWRQHEIQMGASRCVWLIERDKESFPQQVILGNPLHLSPPFFYSFILYWCTAQSGLVLQVRQGYAKASLSFSPSLGIFLSPFLPQNHLVEWKMGRERKSRCNKTEEHWKEKKKTPKQNEKSTSRQERWRGPLSLTPCR